MVLKVVLYGVLLTKQSRSRIRSGQEVMRYGGDFDDRHSDYEFSGDGLMFADRTPKPAMQEVRYYYGLHK